MAAARKKGSGKATASKKSAQKSAAKKPAKSQKKPQAKRKRKRRRVQHGTRSAYVNDRCRCDRCRAANAKWHAERREKAPRDKPGQAVLSAQRSARDTLIVARKAQGWPWSSIAKEAGLKIKAAENAYRARVKDMDQLLEQDAIEILNSLVQGLMLSIGDLEQLSVAALEDRNVSAAVGAKRGANDAREKLQNLLQTSGLLPQDLGTIRLEVDFRVFVKAMFDSVGEFVLQVQSLNLPPKQAQRVLAAADTVNERLLALGEGNPTTNGGSNDG